MYKFNLEPVLQHKIYIENRLQRELAELKKSLFNEEKKLDDCLKERKKHMLDFEQKKRRGILVSDTLLFQNFFIRLSTELKMKRKQIENLENKVAIKNNDLVEAIKKRKSLDKLKEKGLQTYMNRLIKKEHEFMDGVAINNYIRECIKS